MTYPDADKQKAKEAKDFKAMRSEIQELQQICEKLESPVVFSHNDLLSGNVMIPHEVCPEVTFAACASACTHSHWPRSSNQAGQSLHPTPECLVYCLCSLGAVARCISKLHVVSCAYIMMSCQPWPACLSDKLLQLGTSIWTCLCKPCMHPWSRKPAVRFTAQAIHVLFRALHSWKPYNRARWTPAPCSSLTLSTAPTTTEATTLPTTGVSMLALKETTADILMRSSRLCL